MNATKRIAEASAYAALTINEEADKRFDKIAKETTMDSTLDGEELALAKTVYRMGFAAGADYYPDLYKILEKKIKGKNEK